MRLRDRLRDLSYDLLEDRVTRRKLDAPLDLDLEGGGTARCVFVGVDNDVIEREPFVSPLKFDPINGRAGKPPRFGMGEHREEVVSADLALEASASRTR